jgi:hypothetical protein
MTSTELVGPLPAVSFGGGPDCGYRHWRANPKVAYVPPRDTCDPRYAACTEHHVACDCREAEFAEFKSEYRAERADRQEAFDTILAGHRTWQYSPDGQTLIGCMCTGCQIARACHVWPAGDPS